MATVLTKKGGKRYATATAKIEPEREHTVEEAVGALKAMPGAKFDESVDLSLRLGVDPKHADQMVRGAVVLPHGIGKSIRVAVFAKGEKEREAREAGADVIGAEDLVEKVQGGFMEFDTAIATPDLMGQVGRLGKVGRTPRQGAGSTRPHAEPQARHGHLRRGTGGARSQGGEGRVPRRQGG